MNFDNLKGFDPISIKPFNVKNAQDNYASAFYERIIEKINDFEKDLNQNEEVGVRLISFGQTVQIHIQYLGYYDPSLIRFIGTLENGSKFELVQHVSQISFLLMALPKLIKEEPPRRIGFQSKND